MGEAHTEWQDRTRDRQLEALKREFECAGNELKPNGVKIKTGHEPVHTSKSGTCVSIDIEKALWFCYGPCNKGGGLINAVMGLRGLPYAAALQYIREVYGLTENDLRGGPAGEDWPEEEGDEVVQAADSPLIFPPRAWRGVFKTYLDAVAPTTCAPEGYHFGTLMATAGCLLGRRVFQYYGRAKRVYPNGMYLFVGESRDHKGTAGEASIEMLEGYKTVVSTLDGVGSAEGICDWLAGADREELCLPKAGSQFLYVDEFGALATIGGWTASTLFYHLCRLFECPNTYDILFRKNPIHLEQPTLSALACTTPSWFWRSVRETDILGGVGNRFYYLSGIKKEPISRPPRPDENKLGVVYEALRTLLTIEPQEVFLDPQAEAVWDKFYFAWEKSRPRDELSSAMTKRIDLYARKHAMVFAALEGTLPYIMADQLTAAILVGHYSGRCVAALLDAQKQTSQQGECERVIVSFLTGKEKPVPRRVLQQRCSRFDGGVFRKPWKRSCGRAALRNVRGSESTKVCTG
jgi:hypothetical protein